MQQKYMRYSEQSMLTDSDVLDMRSAFATGSVTAEELADLYGINRSTAERIVTGKTWTHVPSPRQINRGKYEVYPDGRIRSISNNQFLTTRFKDGQEVVELRANGKREVTPVSYLVARAFISPNLRSTKSIRFIGDSSDNHFTNIAVGSSSS